MTSLFNKSNRSQVTAADNYPFMACVLKINTDGPGWEKTMIKVLGNMKGVNNFKMVGNGKVLISGKVNPTMLLKVLGGKAGKNAKIVSWQFGECSSNLFLPGNNQYPNNMYSQCGYGSTDGYDQYGVNNYYKGGYGGGSLPVDRPCPWPPVSTAECGNKKMHRCTVM